VGPPGEILTGAASHSREGGNLLAEYGSWQQPPPVRDPLTQHVEHIATQTEIIRMIPRLNRPGFSGGWVLPSAGLQMVWL